ncbi:ell-associated factor Eaf-like [Musca domestica]|uniref:Ell-associated factor Eaf-like n=1 Tax=Musca domestica TaxID=7370 RepID=A0ABM3UMH0_MUSDO|nr:ell-associated factor Eaf-like [Musca domestica]
MSDEVPSQQQQQQQWLLRRRWNSSSPSPSTSGRATPASLGAASVGSAGSSGSSHHHDQQQQQQHQAYQHQYHGVEGHNYLHTFPSAANQSHYFQQQQQQHYERQYATHHHHQQGHLMSPYVQQQQPLQHQQQQQHSLPPLYATSHSLNYSPLLTKRAISFSGNMPLSRQQMDSGLGSPAAAFQRSQATAQSTPNSPHLMPRRTKTTTHTDQQSQQQQQVNPAASLDGAEAPWPHFSTLTEYLDVHQVNNYTQDVPEVGLNTRVGNDWAEIDHMIFRFTSTGKSAACSSN